MNRELLSEGIAIAFREFELTGKIDAKLIAEALRAEAPRTHNAKLLTGVADALDNPSADFRLILVRANRGAPKVRTTLRAYTIALSIAGKLADGIKQEAAIAMVMKENAIKRSTAMKELSIGRKILNAIAKLDVEENSFWSIDYDESN